MTKQRDLKHTIRARMAKTGERYTTARAHVLGERPANPSPRFPGVLDGYDHFGGLQDDTAVVGHMLAHAGVRFPATGEPYTEAMLHGLCGGVGFLYAVFEYRGWPPMLTIVPRSRSMPQTFLAPLFERVGVEADTRNSSSDAAGRKKLDAALDAGRPALCLVDACLLPHSSLPRAMAGAGPHHVAVIGRDGDAYWLDDRALSPIRIGADALAEARAAYRAGKRALTVLGALDGAHDWRAAWLEALADTVTTMRDGDPTVPASFRRNCGFAGIDKWRGLLTDERNKKGWPKVFADGADACAGLRRAYDGINHDYTAPAAGRPLYAEFLHAAAEHLALDGLSDAAASFVEAGAAWQRLAKTIAATPDEAVRRSCEIADARAQALDQGVDAARARELEALGEQRRRLAEDCQLDGATARATYAAMAEILEEILVVERRAIDLIDRAIA